MDMVRALVIGDGARPVDFLNPCSIRRLPCRVQPHPGSQYFGRKVFAWLAAPLFRRIDVHHEAPLDRLDRTMQRLDSGLAEAQPLD